MAIFREVGPYEIVRQIGRGMSPVFLATDSRNGASVALKVVPVGSDEEAREILEAEQQGANLQRRFSELTQYVPRVYEVDRASDYFYIAMEYIDGEDLSTVLARGPIAPDRAVRIAIQLCRFLEEVDRVAGAEGESALTLLHNDIKPGNIRLEAGDRVKILDFGAAKVLSLSRRATRNVFGSIPYLSPECIETGKRDRHTDAWALGVLLYEMVAGRAPFHADSTVNLERRIRSRLAPEPAPGVPSGLAAVIAKLLAPYPEDRYDGASAIRADLENVEAGNETAAEREVAGRGALVADEPATRRMREPMADEAATRPVARRGAESLDSASPLPAGSPSTSRTSGRGRRRVIAAFLLLLMFVAGNEAVIARRASRLAATVPLQEFGGLNDAWVQYGTLADRSYLVGFGASGLGRALVRQSQVLADRVIGNYRSPSPTVREAQWESAADVLRRALTLAPGDVGMRASLRYVEGHLHRIDGEALKSRRQVDQAQRELAEAVSAFREAATLRPEWPDPHLGLARTFIYGLEDIDRGADAMQQAETLGYEIGARETAQLGDGYRARGETLQRAAESLAGLPQEHESLTRAVEAYRRALELYSKIADFADVPARIRTTQNRLAIAEQKLGRAASDRGPSERNGAIDRLIDAISGAF
jgi:tetratricopeptide (TPR) repeat protein/predicted Ser/Thr protein kinase